MTEKEERAQDRAAAKRHRAEQERLQRMAAEGDVDGLWEVLTRPRPVAFDGSEIFPLLLRALEARARRFPAEFGAEMLARVVALTSYLVLRSHHLLTLRVDQYDKSSQGRGRVELPPPYTDRLVTPLVALHGSLAEVLHAQAVTARAWELARGKKLENDRALAQAEAAPDRKVSPKPRRKPAPRARPVIEPAGDGRPSNRIAGLLDGLGPKAKGAHRDE